MTYRKLPNIVLKSVHYNVQRELKDWFHPVLAVYFLWVSYGMVHATFYATETGFTRLL